MSGLQFIVAFVQAVAWPLALLGVVIVLRRQIGDILGQVASGLRRLRAGESDAEFERIVTQTRSELTATVTLGGSGSAGIPALLRLGVLADDDPSAAILQGFASLQDGLRELLSVSGKLIPTQAGDPTALARFARDQGLAPESLVRSVDQVGSLRNLAASDPSRVTRDQAVKYLALIDALMYAISTCQGRAISARQPEMAQPGLASTDPGTAS
jgi:hypothetical protein